MASLLYEYRASLLLNQPAERIDRPVEPRRWQRQAAG